MIIFILLLFFLQVKSENEFLSVNVNSACALFDDQKVRCWGHTFESSTSFPLIGNQPGQMSNNLPAIDLGNDATPVKVSNAFASGCAIMTNSKLKCWGWNTEGILGSGSSSSINYADSNQMGDNLAYVDLGENVLVRDICHGALHVCVLTSLGKIKCWGWNLEGQLGYGDTNPRGASTNTIGDNLNFVDLGQGVRAKAIRCGYHATCAILESNQVKCWGKNDYGQLGLGDTRDRGLQTTDMGDNLPTINLGTSKNVLDISLGFDHTCAILTDNEVKCWGRNNKGQLGYGDTRTRGDGPGEMGNNLAVVDIPSNVIPIKVNLGTEFSCILDNGGSVRCWGSGEQGKLGTGNTANRGDGPGEMGANLVEVPLAGTFIGVFGKVLSLCAVESGTFKVKCWGNNAFGQLGYGDTNHRGDGPGEMGSALPYLNFGSRTIKVDSTFSPTLSPTQSPTTFPTRSPTTPIPSQSPTKFPTRSPTNSPTPPVPIDQDLLYQNLIIGSSIVVGVLFVVGAVSAFFPTSKNPNFI